MTLYDSVITNLKGVIGSRREGVLLSFLDIEYESIVGEKFPLRKLGYDTLYDFIKSNHEHFQLENSGRFCRVINMVGRVENDTTLDLINLIQGTRSKNKNQSGFRPRYQPGYQSNYQNNFNSIPSVRFTHRNIYNDNFSNPFNMGFSIPPNNTTVTTKYIGFCREPNIEVKFNSISEQKKRSNLIVPSQCLVSTKVIAEKTNILVISDDEESSIIPRPDVGTQTPVKEFKTMKRNFCTYTNLELVNIIIDVIIEFKQIKYNDIIKIKIDGELYFKYRYLTGVNIDPTLFYDYVLNSVDSPKIQYIYKGLIYLDPSKSHCLFNIKSIYKTKNRLPEYKFVYSKEYIVEIVKIFHDNIIAYKISNKLNGVLDWKKYVTSDQDKEIIETQQFWSWIPGSLCLVQLPYNIVKKLNVSSVERAVIISTNIAMLIDAEVFNSQPCILHNTSFYLIDHEKEVEELLSCSSSYQEVKSKAKERNNKEITFVCNMSISAMNTPSKIQFTKLENFKNISSTFLNTNNQLKQNSLIVLKNMEKMTFIFHFQSMYSSFSKIYENLQKVFEESMTIKNNSMLLNSFQGKDRKVDYSDIIVISDDEETSLKSNAKSNSSTNSNNVLNQSTISQNKVDIKTLLFNNSDKQYPQVSYLNKSTHIPVMEDSSILKIVGSQSSHQINKSVKVGEEHIISKTTQPVYSEKIAYKIASIEEKSLELGDKKTCKADVESLQPSNSEKVRFKIASHKTLTDNTNWRINESLDVQKYNEISNSVEKSRISVNSEVFEHITLNTSTKDISVNNFDNITTQSLVHENDLRCIKGLHSTPYYCKKNNETISVVSFSESDESFSSIINDMNSSIVPLNAINYLENNLNPSRKCLKPLTSELINLFSGKLVQIMHIQTGSAVLMLLNSVKLMKRDIKMRSLKKQLLLKAEKISVSDFYIWRDDSEIPINDDFLLVEIMQVLSQNTVLINKVHQGLLSVVNVKDLYCLPEEKNGDIYGNIHTLLGPSIGVFDLHMFPDWFTPDDKSNFSHGLFTAYFIEEKLILEYFEEPCKFLNIEIISSIEKSLTVNHCNIKSARFIEMLSKNLLLCRLYVGNILEMISCEILNFDNFPITKALRKVTINDNYDVWFTSVLTKSEGNQDHYQKLSPHNFMTDEFCADRVTYDERRHNLRLMEHQNVYINAPDNLEGLYRFDKTKVKGSLKGHEEFYYRYMLAGAAEIPDLKNLYNKLIFDIRAF